MMNKHVTVAKPQNGTTLIELIVSIVVISVALTGLMMTISLSMRHSADGFVQIRAAELAQAYMDMLVTMEYDANCTVTNFTQSGDNNCGDYRNQFTSLDCYEQCLDVNGYDWISDETPWNVEMVLNGYEYDNYQVRFRIQKNEPISDVSNSFSVEGKLIEVYVQPGAVHDEIGFSTFRAAF
jgi:MSHA pilin protein MshD